MIKNIFQPSPIIMRKYYIISGFYALCDSLSVDKSFKLFSLVYAVWWCQLRKCLHKTQLYGILINDWWGKAQPIIEGVIPGLVVLGKKAS